MYSPKSSPPPHCF